MKLDLKRTFFVGFAFMSICAFWSLYDFAIPLMLKNTFHMSDGDSGYILALDNILALFLLPFFGMLSDKNKSKMGRRTPFIVAGTIAAVVLMIVLAIADKAANAMLFYVVLGLLLVAMGTYRSPAVALMPDVTPKPLRSKGNAVINLMGAVGGIFSLAAIALLVKKTADGSRSDYTIIFLMVAVLMIISVIVLVFTTREKKLVAQMEEINYGISKEEEAQEYHVEGSAEKLSSESWRSLLLILSSVFLWFMGYNAVTSVFSKYATTTWGMTEGGASLCMMVAQGGAILSYLPVGILSSHFGRKRMIQFGIILLTACFASGSLFAGFSPALYVMFALVGSAWACINVNSYPMVVELSRGPSVGKYTGYYYTFSMAAQIITPILSGQLLEHVGYWTLFPYAAVLVALAFITISLTKHGDSKPVKLVSKLEAFQAED